MSTLHFDGQIGFPGCIFQVGLSLIEFNEDDVTIIYSPALNLSGYGYNPNEAVSAPFIIGHKLRKIIRNHEYEEADKYIKKFS
jgi:hypothetical protein